MRDNNLHFWIYTTMDEAKEMFPFAKKVGVLFVLPYWAHHMGIKSEKGSWYINQLLSLHRMPSISLLSKYFIKNMD